MEDEGHTSSSSSCECTDAAAGPEEGEGGQRESPVAEGQAAPERPASDGGQSDERPQSGPEGAQGRGAPGSPEPSSHVGESAVGVLAIPSPRGERAPPAPAASGDAATSFLRPGSRLLEFSLTVPFGSPLEADMARRSLVTYAQRQQEMVHKELTVTGSVLTVSVLAEAGAG
ncbi:cancer/testis antigen 1-like [Dipodomys spectabilis]|uniref:cancer/testis antigen 1-like n=1 Tax=Dipodomys spectabilis TaxID=105255 RepID=UPI001C539969|nr:cancer/testis antigen 1-like [Dipodomys spectabilis]XP_042523455.1 cancer/testis antigen 1-like [Dipodomys spectabilis]